MAVLHIAAGRVAAGPVTEIRRHGWQMPLAGCGVTAPALTAPSAGTRASL